MQTDTQKLRSDSLSPVLERLSSFGKQQLSNKKQNPIYRFGSGTRRQWCRTFFTEELSEPVGPGSPGPVYKYEDTITFKRQDGGKFSRAARFPEKESLYKYFDEPDTNDMISANKYSKKSAAATKLKTNEIRFKEKKKSLSPGPIYQPAHRSNRILTPKYSMGAKLATNTGKLSTGTPLRVGPGHYSPETWTTDSKHLSPKRYTFDKSKRIKDLDQLFNHETFDVSSNSIGKQVSSRRISTPQYSNGKGTREKRQLSGMFPSAMTASRPKTVRIEHRY